MSVAHGPVFSSWREVEDLNKPCLTGMENAWDLLSKQAVNSAEKANCLVH